MVQSTYEAYALRYGTTSLQKAGRYHRFSAYGEPDQTVPLDFYFWLLRNDERTVLVDCGYDDVRTLERGYTQDTHPLTLLERMGVRPEDVDHVVLSHMHFDHIGNVDLFPRATFSVAQAEFDFWTGPYADREHLKIAGDPIEIEMVSDLARDGRVHFIESAEELLPGIVVRPVRGHTAGQLITEVTSTAGNIVLASDAIHFYEEMRLDRPFWLFCDLEGMYRGYELLRTFEAQPNTTVVAGHDRAVTEMFVRVADECFDLTVRADG
jgi:glyoxylase-like metal-dependent hydrolase (beta-lactamase superfamily II)